MSYELLRGGKPFAKGGVRVSIPRDARSDLRPIDPGEIVAPAKTLALDVAKKLAPQAN
jgi:hypothetical protein